MSSNQASWPFIINLGNSIIGVSVLAMPFCFKECGVLLGMLLLFASAWLTHTSCNLLIKGAFSSRKRSYEYLALHTFGPAGKLCVEISIIGLLIGTCVAFFVIIGDLGPAIISRLLNIENSWNLRLLIMVFLALTVALPLGLLKNVESLANVSALSIGFYSVFIAEIFATAFPNLWSGVWVQKVVYWNPEGVFRCIPIFSLAFSCQTQLFVMCDALHEPSLTKMKSITRSAIGMVTIVYLCVGYFGYVAFCDEKITGDILLIFRPTIFSESVKLGFVIAIAASFPLVIFPLRAAIFTLLFFKDQEKQHDVMGSIYIPDLHLKGITFGIIISTLIIGILLPNIEFVLALTGSTMGSMICFIFPAVMYISVMSMSKSSGKIVAQVVLFLGFTILLASTYVTLNAQDKNQDTGPFNPVPPPVGKLIPDNDYGVVENPVENQVAVDNVDANSQEKRQEPPAPQPPDDSLPAEPGRDETDLAGVNNPLEVNDKESDVKDEDKKEKVKKQQAQDEADSAEQAQDKIADEQKAEKKAADVQKSQNEETKELLNQLKEQQKVQEGLIEKQKEIIEQLEVHKKEAHDNDNSRQVQQQVIGQAPQQVPVQDQQGQQVQYQQPAVVPGQQQVPGQSQQQQMPEPVPPQGQQQMPPQGQQQMPPQGQQQMSPQGQQQVPNQGQQPVAVQGQQHVQELRGGDAAQEVIAPAQQQNREQQQAADQAPVIQKRHSREADAGNDVNGQAAAGAQHGQRDDDEAQLLLRELQQELADRPVIAQQAQQGAHVGNAEAQQGAHVGNAEAQQGAHVENAKAQQSAGLNAGQAPADDEAHRLRHGDVIPRQAAVNSDESYVSKLLVNLAKQYPNIESAIAKDESSLSIKGLIAGLNAITDREQWNIQLQKNIQLILSDDKLTNALHNIAHAYSVEPVVADSGNLQNSKASQVDNAVQAKPVLGRGDEKKSEQLHQDISVHAAKEQLQKYNVLESNIQDRQVLNQAGGGS